MVLVPEVSVDPAPLVSHEPDTVHDPLVRTILPDVPPTMATVPTVTVAWFAFTTPPLPTVSPFEPKLNVPELPATSVRVPATAIAPLAVIVPVVMLRVVPDPTVIDPTFRAEVLPVIPPLPTKLTAAPPVRLLPPVERRPDP